MSEKPVLSVVDYEAWNKGYMPPSEHRLIDALSYRGASVKASASLKEGSGWWFVVQGDAWDDEDTFDMMIFVAERQIARLKKLRAKQQDSATDEASPDGQDSSDSGA